MIKKTLVLAALLFGLFSPTLIAKQYKIVLIHGLQPQQLIINGDVAASGQNYWGGYWDSLADARIDWPSFERIEQKITTDYVWPKLKEFSENKVIYGVNTGFGPMAQYKIDKKDTIQLQYNLIRFSSINIKVKKICLFIVFP